VVCILSAADFARLLRSLRVERSLEDYLSPLFRHTKFSDIGVMVRSSSSIRKTLIRKLKTGSGSLGRTGKIVFFREKTVDELAKFMEYVYFLVTDVVVGEGRISITHLPASTVGVYILEVKARRSKLKQRFEPWKVVYSGRVCVNRVCRDFNWFIVAPTYSKKYYVVVCHSEDYVRRVEGGRIDCPIVNLMESYVWGKKRKTVSRAFEALATPVFSYSLA